MNKEPKAGLQVDPARRVSLDVSVIIVTYNSKHVVGQALQPLSESLGVEIIVVDNNSIDGTVAYVQGHFPRVRVITSPTNAGFAKAVNVGIQASSNTFILLLNPDASVTLQTIGSLQEGSTERGVGIAAPQLDTPDADTPSGRQRTVSAGYEPTAWRMFTHFSGLSRFSHHQPALKGHYLLPGNLRRPVIDVDWATGACIMFTRDVWTELGGLSERWFMYAEDIEFCHRVRLSGRVVRLFSELHATHLVGQSDANATFSANPAWVLHLHEYYSSALARTATQIRIWALVTTVGLLSRSAIFFLMSLKGGPTRSARRRESKRFLAFSLALSRRITGRVRP